MQGKVRSDEPIYLQPEGLNCDDDVGLPARSSPPEGSTLLERRQRSRHPRSLISRNCDLFPKEEGFCFTSG